MILTILKQTTRYYLDEKDFEVANVYADLYCKMIIQYVSQRKQAIAALKDLAYEWYINRFYRNSERFYNIIKDHYGIISLNDKDLEILGDICQKIGDHTKAIKYYQRIVRFYPHSSDINRVYRKISLIYEICNNKSKAKMFKSLAEIEKVSTSKPKVKSKVSRTHKKTA